ncbi:MAG: type II toxin-antitoxin system VapC family toxin [Rhizobiaceae bacterium]
MKRVGIDTNILIRLLVDDDPVQRPVVEAFGRKLNHEFNGFVTMATMLEINWALASQYGYGRAECVAAMRRILQIRGMEIEHHDAVVRAVRLVELHNADFADALIAARSLESGCDHVVTLDRKAAKSVPGMELLE